MKLLLNTQEERCRIEIYNEYLRKLPELLKQLESVEKMYEKALLEEQMLLNKDPDEYSVKLYADRLIRTKEHCLARMADIREQSSLIFALKAQIEAESSTLQTLMKK